MRENEKKSAWLRDWVPPLVGPRLVSGNPNAAPRDSLLKSLNYLQGVDSLFLRTILYDHWWSKSPKIKNKLRKISASELTTQGKIYRILYNYWGQLKNNLKNRKNILRTPNLSHNLLILIKKECRCGKLQRGVPDGDILFIFDFVFWILASCCCPTSIMRKPLLFLWVIINGEEQLGQKMWIKNKCSQKSWWNLKVFLYMTWNFWKCIFFESCR